MKYIRDNDLIQVLSVVSRTPHYKIDVIDNETRKLVDTSNEVFRPQDYIVVEIRMNDMLMKYELYVVKKEK
jgi:hypothetical protein